LCCLDCICAPQDFKAFSEFQKKKKAEEAAAKAAAEKK